MKKLIQKFTDKLGVSKGNAIARIISMMIIALVIIVVTIILFGVFFLHHPKSLEIQTDTISNNLIQVPEILNGDVLVGLDQFKEIAGNRQVFVSMNNEKIYYYIKVDNISYVYYQLIYSEWRYMVINQEINNNVIFSVLKINPFSITIILLIYAVIVVGLVCIFVLCQENDTRYVFIK